MDPDDWIAAAELLATVVGIVVGLVRRPPMTPAHNAPWAGHVRQQEGLRRLLTALQQLRDAAVVRVDVAAGDPQEAKAAAAAVLAAYERARHLAATTSADDVRRVALEAAQEMVGAEGALAGEAPLRAAALEAHEKIRRAFGRAERLIEARLRELDRLTTTGR